MAAYYLFLTETDSGPDVAGVNLITTKHLRFNKKKLSVTLCLNPGLVTGHRRGPHCHLNKAQKKIEVQPVSQFCW